MLRFPTASFVLATLVVLGCAAGNSATADVITSFDGAYQVGIEPWGNLYDVPSGIGFLRMLDNYDPIAPGSPREAWGVSAGGTGGYADPNFLGVLNLVPDGPPLFFSDFALISTFLEGDGHLLRVLQYYRFAEINTNILRIEILITNVSGQPQHVKFAREVDWNIAPTQFTELTQVPPAPGLSVSDASFFGLNSADPLMDYGPNSAGNIGGLFGPADLGAGIQLDFGILAANDSKGFLIYYAISQPAQTPAELAAQVTAVAGPTTFVITSFDSGMAPINSAALAVIP
jgi:hypothetical protein